MKDTAAGRVGHGVGGVVGADLHVAVDQRTGRGGRAATAVHEEVEVHHALAVVRGPVRLDIQVERSDVGVLGEPVGLLEVLRLSRLQDGTHWRGAVQSSVVASGAPYCMSSMGVLGLRRPRRTPQHSAWPSRVGSTAPPDDRLEVGHRGRVDTGVGRGVGERRARTDAAQRRSGQRDSGNS